MKEGDAYKGEVNVTKVRTDQYQGLTTKFKLMMQDKQRLFILRSKYSYLANSSYTEAIIIL